MLHFRPGFLLLLLCVPALAAAEPAERFYASKSSACPAASFIDPLVPQRPECSEVRQEGRISATGCEPSAAGERTTCRLNVAGQATAQGLPPLRKSLQVEVQQVGEDTTAPLCAADATTEELTCSGTVTSLLRLAPHQCTEVRVRATLREGGLASLTTRTELGFGVCRGSGSGLTLA